MYKSTVLLLFILLLGSPSYAIKYILVSQILNDSSTVPNNENGKFEIIVKNLAEAHNYILMNLTVNGNIEDDVTIFIRGGEYRHNYLWWQVTSPDYTMKISSYKHEKVIFDGQKDDKTLNTKFLQLKKKYERTNLWIEGLIIQNYTNGIGLGLTERDSLGVYFAGIQNSHNTIKNNIFRNIGNKFSVKFQDSFSALGLSNSSFNTIEGNVFYKNENDKKGVNGNSSSVLIHSIYLANYSSNNIIRNNFISLCSGDPIRLRNSSNNNVIENNYIDQSGKLGFISEWYRTVEDYPDTPELPSNNTIIEHNVCTFSYPAYSENISLFKSLVNNGLLDLNFIEGGNNFVIGVSE